MIDENLKENVNMLADMFNKGLVLKNYSISYSRNGCTLSENVDYNYGPKIDYTYVKKPDNTIIYKRRRVIVRNDELITTYNYNPSDCFSLIDGVSNRPYQLKIYTPKFYEFKEFNPLDVKYYTTDIKSCFAEYENLFGIDIDIPLPEKCIVKRYGYNGQLAIAEYDDRKNNKDLLFLFNVNGNDNRIILTIDNLKDKVLLIFIKEFDGYNSPTNMYSISYYENKKETNILANKFIDEIDQVPAGIVYDEYGLPLIINGVDAYKFTDINEDTNDFSRIYIYNTKWAFPYNIRDCAFINNLDIWNIDILRVDENGAQKGEMERYVLNME